MNAVLGAKRNDIQYVFDNAADTYGNAAALDRSVGSELLSRLDLLKALPIHILDAGCGTGICSLELVQRYPNAMISGIDLSSKMLQVASRREGIGCMQFIKANSLQLPFADNQFDLIVSNLMLPWCDVAAVLTEFRRLMRPAGALMFSTFGPDTLIELREAWARMDERQHVHDFYDMHDIGDALLRTGFAEPIVDVDRVTVTYPSTDALFADLKNSGTVNIHPSRRRSLTGKQRFAAFRDTLDTFRDEDNRIPLTYEVIYGHAWTPREQDITTASVPLESLLRDTRLK